MFISLRVFNLAIHSPRKIYYIYPMFELCLQKKFTASHALKGGDWGNENFPHSHDYKLEWILEAKELNSHNYVTDLVELEEQLDCLLNKYHGKFLNDLGEFSNTNPSLEFFAQVIWKDLFPPLAGGPILGGRVVLWENDHAWACYKGNL